MHAAVEHASAIASLAGCEGFWFVAVTLPRQEQRLAVEMQAVGATVVNLKETVVSTRVDPAGHIHRDKYERPIFPGYLFVNGDSAPRPHIDPRGEHWFRCRESSATLAVIDVKDQARLHSQLCDLMRWHDASGGKIASTKIAPGQRVIIRSGPFRGTEARLVDRVEGPRVFLAIGEIGRMIPLEVSIDDVEPAYAN